MLALYLKPRTVLRILPQVAGHVLAGTVSLVEAYEEANRSESARRLFDTAGRLSARLATPSLSDGAA